MKTEVKSSTFVKPMIAKPSSTLWLSNLDLISPPNYHTPIAIFYRSTAAADFFDSSVLKAALSRVLVEFHPLAGRLMTNEHNDRTEVNCNDEGALIVEAESDGTVDELGDFSGMAKVGLIPPVDNYSGGISTFPVALIQLTRFKCGGVCLGFAIHHEVADGISMFHFIKAWSQMARGLDISVAPYMDRRVLSARDPPQPHVEFQPPPTLKIAPRHNSTEIMFSIFKLTRDQLNALKNNCLHAQAGNSNRVTFSTYVALAGHVWRCVTKARALPGDQESKLFIPIDGRPKMQPPLPQGYFGNAVIVASCIALCGELNSNPLEFAARKIHDTITQMDDRYLRSFIDSLEVKQQGINLCSCPNLSVNSWAGFGVHEMDFGLWKHVFMGYCGNILEGMNLVLPSVENDGSLLYAVTLAKEQMPVFQRLLYNI